MQRFSFAIVLLTICILSSSANAQYWFQAGAQGATSSEFNHGARVSIQTISPQPVSSGSLGYWVGETLSNGAFIQAGYEIPNSSSYYTTNCGPSGCSGSVFVSANTPAWFWEYFPANYNGNGFYGAIGTNNSVGVNGAFNNYSFISNGTTWSVFLNSNMIGSVNLGTSTSGTNPPLALAEYADVANGKQPMPKVIFKNLQYYDGSQFKYVQSGFTYVGYGKGSKQDIPVPYGIQEMNGFVNYFQVGSGIPVPPQYSQLWSLGYTFSVASRYGNINQTGLYLAYAPVNLQSPTLVNVSPSQREVFQGWIGYGAGSYTGPLPSIQLAVSSNITEVAQWKTQYFVNVTSVYGNVSGGGWYYANSTANLLVPSSPVVFDTGKRAIFENWSTGAQSQATQIIVSGAENISANWKVQYLVNATSAHGNVSGNGWYFANSSINVTLDNPYVYVNPTTRLAFTQWSNGYYNRTIKQTLAAPLIINAEFAQQYLVSISGLNSNGEPIIVNSFEVGGTNSNSPIFLFANRTYRVKTASYKGVTLLLNYSLKDFSPGQNIALKLPVYNVNISAYSLIKTPINATLNVSFENGTRLIKALGPEGTTILPDVPDGYVYGYADYLGERQGINVASGSAGKLTFLTPLVFIGAFLLLVAIFIIERIIFAEIRMKNKQPRKKGR